MQILNATFHYNVYGKYHGQVRLTEIFFMQSKFVWKSIIINIQSMNIYR